MLPVLLATVLSLPPKVAEIPVSAPSITRAALTQMSPKIASNGSLAMAIWYDAGSMRGRVIASRIAGDGTPLDPLGILVAERSEPRDIFWNGDGFTAIVVVDSEYQALVDIDRDGHVGPLRRLDTTGYYAARTDAGASTRLLFLPGNSAAAGAIFDPAGNVVRIIPNLTVGNFVLTAWNGREFLVLRDLTTSQIIDRDGNITGTAPSGLAPGSIGIIGALTGDTRGGFVLVNYDLHGEVTAWHLDEHGTFDGRTTIAPAPANHYTTSSIFAQPAAEGYVASWIEPTTDMYSSTLVSRSGAAPSRGMQWTGGGWTAVVEPKMNLVATRFIGGPPAIVEENADEAAPSFNMAANGSTLMFAYDRVDHTNGHVFRVFLDPRMLVSRRRIAR